MSLALTLGTAYPKPRFGATRYWPPLENRVSNFKLTVLSRQKEFLSGTGTIGKLCFSSFALYTRFVWQNHFGGCKFEKGVARMSRKCSNYGSGIHNLRYFGIFRTIIFQDPTKYLKLWQLHPGDGWSSNIHPYSGCSPILTRIKVCELRRRRFLSPDTLTRGTF